MRLGLDQRPGSLFTRDGPTLIVIALSSAVVGALLLGAAFGPDALPDRNASLFMMLTGLPDPLCGLTHSIFAIGQLDWSAAVRYNPLGFMAVPLAVVLLPRTGLALAHDRPLSWSPRALSVLVVVGFAAWIWQLTTLPG